MHLAGVEVVAQRQRALGRRARPAACDRRAAGHRPAPARRAATAAQPGGRGEQRSDRCARSGPGGACAAPAPAPRRSRAAQPAAPPGRCAARSRGQRADGAASRAHQRQGQAERGQIEVAVRAQVRERHQAQVGQVGHDRPEEPEREPGRAARRTRGSAATSSERERGRRPAAGLRARAARPAYSGDSRAGQRNCSAPWKKARRPAPELRQLRARACSGSSAVRLTAPGAPITHQRHGEHQRGRQRPAAADRASGCGAPAAAAGRDRTTSRAAAPDSRSPCARQPSSTSSERQRPERGRAARRPAAARAASIAISASKRKNAASRSSR